MVGGKRDISKKTKLVDNELLEYFILYNETMREIERLFAKRNIWRVCDKEGMSNQVETQKNIYFVIKDLATQPLWLGGRALAS